MRHTTIALVALTVASLSSVASAQTPSHVSPMERARACNGDNACIIRALEGRPRRWRSEEELELLMTSYRIAGRNADVARVRRALESQYPNGAWRERHPQG